MRSSISSRPSDVVSALLGRHEQMQPRGDRGLLRAYPMPLLERLVAPEAPIR